MQQETAQGQKAGNSGGILVAFSAIGDSCNRPDIVGGRIAALPSDVENGYGRRGGPEV
jgi:hypothetical protein